jgi:osmotically inducible protein OsmC
MAVRTSRAVWEGAVKGGRGTISLGSGAFEFPYSFASRFEDGGGSNPEELIAAAHAACFSMALAHRLSEAGHGPIRIETHAAVHLTKSDRGFEIPRIDLETEGDVPGLSEEEFARIAAEAGRTCPVSKLLSAATIRLRSALAPGRAHEQPVELVLSEGR